MHAGAVIENVIINADTRAVDYDDISITENTRCAYPLEVAAELLFTAAELSSSL